MSNKQEATFENVEGWIDAGDRGIAVCLLNIEGHPLLGNEPWVRTSRVESVSYGDNGQVSEIVTKNTRYTRREPAPQAEVTP